MRPDRPLHCVDPGIYPASAAVNSPPVPFFSPSGIYGDYYALAAEALRALRDQFGAQDSGRVDRDLVSSLSQDSLHVIDCSYPAADSEGNKNPLSHSADHVRYRIPGVTCSRYIEKYQLIGSQFGVGLSGLHGISRITQLNKIDPFDNAPVLDVQAGDDSLREHLNSFLSGARAPSASLRSQGSSRGSSCRQLHSSPGETGMRKHFRSQPPRQC